MAELVEEPEKSKLNTIADWLMDIIKQAVVSNIDNQLGLNTSEE